MSDSEEDLPPGKSLPESLSERLKKHEIQRSRRSPKAPGAAKARSRRAVDVLDRPRCPTEFLRTFVF